MHAEGIISKLASAKYTSGRSANWIKCKCLLEQELVIGGFTLPGASHTGMHGIGSLLLGYYRDGKLIYAGRTGTGFNQKTHKMIRDKLNALVQRECPFYNPPAEARKDSPRWVKPTLVGQVRFANWTADNLVRQAAFLGLREDKPANEVTREESVPTPKSATGRRASSETAAASHAPRSVAAKAQPKASGKKSVPSSAPPIRLTHPEKVLDAESGLTKRMLADYYWAVAPRMLPHVAGRPLSLVRCPEGSGAPCFFQKHVNHMLPPGIGAVDVPEKKTGVIEKYITLDSPEALAALAQMGVLEVHPWGSCNDDLEHPDRLVFDLDPDPSLSWSTVTEAAAEVRARLKKLGLTSFLKTTGGKGLHVVIPIEPTLDWPAAKDFAHRFVMLMERQNPRLYLTKMTKSARVGKIYLDYLRNERGATAVAPFSPRARSGAPVSMPLAWSELDSPDRPVFHVADFDAWRSRLSKDPWKAIFTTRQTVSLELLKAVA
jgi:bifunctional non-homologous end joining protein LigD